MRLWSQELFRQSWRCREPSRPSLACCFSGAFQLFVTPPLDLGHPLPPEGGLGGQGGPWGRGDQRCVGVTHQAHRHRPGGETTERPSVLVTSHVLKAPPADLWPTALPRPVRGPQSCHCPDDAAGAAGARPPQRLLPLWIFLVRLPGVAVTRHAHATWGPGPPAAVRSKTLSLCLCVPKGRAWGGGCRGSATALRRQGSLGDQMTLGGRKGGKGPGWGDDRGPDPGPWEGRGPPGR